MLLVSVLYYNKCKIKLIISVAKSDTKFTWYAQCIVIMNLRINEMKAQNVKNPVPRNSNWSRTLGGGKRYCVHRHFEQNLPCLL